MSCSKCGKENNFNDYWRQEWNSQGLCRKCYTEPARIKEQQRLERLRSFEPKCRELAKYTGLEAPSGLLDMRTAEESYYEQMKYLERLKSEGVDVNVPYWERNKTKRLNTWVVRNNGSIER